MCVRACSCEERKRLIARKMKFSIKDFFSKYDQIRKFPADLVTFTEEILNGKVPYFVQC